MYPTNGPDAPSDMIPTNNDSVVPVYVEVSVIAVPTMFPLTKNLPVEPLRL